MLEARQIACIKGDRVLFRDLSLAVAPGEMLRVRGPNGVGKTSLLRILTGLATPESGSVHWRSGDIRRERDAFHRALVYLGHAPAVSDQLTALENLAMACIAAGEPADEAACARALERIGLDRSKDLPAGVLSEGQRRRVGLARLLLAGERRLWILDEPFSALDDGAQNELCEVLDTHCAGGGTVVFTSHQPVTVTAAPRVLALGEFDRSGQ